MENITHAECQPALPISVVPVTSANSPNVTMIPMENITNAECQSETLAIRMAPAENISPYTTMYPMDNNTDTTIIPLQNVTDFVQIQENQSNLGCAEDASRNCLDTEQRVKKTLSWASNYLQSIGHSQPKLTKLTNSAYQKFFPNSEEGRRENTNKNVSKPSFRYLDVAQNYPNSLQQSSYTDGGRKITPMEPNSATNDNNSHDTKLSIKSNLLDYKLYNSSYSDKTNTQNNLNNSNTANFEKSVTAIKTDCLLIHSYSKSCKKNNIDNEKHIRDSKSQNFEENCIQNSTKFIPSSHLISRGKNYKDTKHGKYVKNTNSTSTSNKNISVKKYAGIIKNRNKDVKDRKPQAKTNNVDVHKSSSKSGYKTKDRLESWASDRIKNDTNKTLHSHVRDGLEAWAFNRIKTHSEKPPQSNSNCRTQQTTVSKAVNNSKSKSSEPKKEKIKLKYREPTLKKVKGNHKTKSKTPTKSNDGDHINNLKLSTKSNENYNNKKLEILQSTPIKSVVQVTNNYDLDSPLKTVPENGHNIEDLRNKLIEPEKNHTSNDLRTKLKRKYQNSQSTKRDNLIITVQNDNNDKEDIIDKQLMAGEKSKPEKKTRKYKKIKLVINVICEKNSESSESDSDVKNEVCPIANVDLSFLDDFNVDDIVDSLNDQEDKVNSNTSPFRAKNSKNSISEKLIGEEIIKNKDKEIKCMNLNKRLHTESPQVKIDSKQILNLQEDKENNLKNIKNENYMSSEITGHEIQTSNNITCPDNKIGKNKLGGNSTKKPNELITSSIKQNTNHNTNICPTLLNQTTNPTNIDEQLKKDIHNAGIVSKNLGTETQIEARDVVIIDLTQIENSIPHEKKTISLNNDIVNIQSSKQEARKQGKTKEVSEMSNIIDLTVSRETTSNIKKDVATSVIRTSAQQQLKIKETSTKYDIERSKDKVSEMKINTEEDIQISQIPLRPQNNETKKTVTKSDIIDLTSLTEITSSINNEAKKGSDITIETKDQQHAANDNFVNNNMHAQSTEIASDIKNNCIASSAKNYNINNARITATSPRLLQHKANEISLNDRGTKNDTEDTAVGYDMINIQTTEITLEPQQHEPNKTLSKNATYHLRTIEMEQITEDTSLKNYNINAQVTKIAAVPKQHNSDESSSNIEIGNITKEAFVKIDISNAQLSETASAYQRTLSNNVEIKNSTTEAAVAKAIVNIQTTVIAPEQQNEANLPSPNKNMNIICGQVNCNNECTNKKREQVRTVKETNLNDDGEDILSITDSLDENLTSYNSEASDSDNTPIYSPTCSVKSLVIFDAKEVTTTPTTEIIKSTPESKATETQKKSKSHIDNNKDNNDSAVTVKLNWKQTEKISALENRMMEYFGANYNIESLINHGKFSKIYLCKDKNGRKYALKVLNKGKRITGCRVEDMLKDLQKDIPRKNYHCVFLVDGFAMMEQWCFLMDYYPKNMQEVLYENRKCFHIDVVQMLARQLISAVLILRNHNIMHLDIKPAHILMNTTNDRLKLAGFDESQYLEGLSVLPCVGTVNYRPPEVILGFPYFGKIDVWSTALVIYEMCTNRQLFPGHYNNDILYKQMCTLGNIPFEMMIQSVFTNNHYRGAYFARRYGPGGQKWDLIDTFKKSMRLPTSLFEAYHRDWGKFRTRKQKADDSAKLRILRDLLEEMLILDPTCRTPIEFVYANSFIYQTFDFSF